MTDRMSSFALRLPLLEGESLASLEIRLSRENAYGSDNMPQILLRDRWKERGIRDSATNPIHSYSYETLSGLTGLSQTMLYNSTFHRFAGTLTPPAERLDYVKLDTGESYPLLSAALIHKQTRAPRLMAFCPECLNECFHHKIQWSFLPVSVCLKHKKMLLTECSRCGSSQSILNLLNGTCPQCHLSLAENEAVSVSDDEERLTAHAVLQSLLGLSVSMGHRPSVLPDVPPRILLYLIQGIRMSVMHNPAISRQDDISIPPLDTVRALKRLVDHTTNRMPELMYYSYAYAFAAVLDWPYRFHVLLSRLHRETKRSRSGLHGLGSFYTRWIAENWLRPEFQFVQDEFKIYLDRTIVPSAAKVNRYREKQDTEDRSSQTYLLPAHVKAILHIDDNTLKRLIEQDILPCNMLPKKKWNTDKTFFAKDVLNLKKQWDSGLTLDATASRLGVTEAITKDLLEFGLLNALRGPTADGSDEWLMEDESVTVLNQRIWALSAPLDDQDMPDMLTLKQAAQKAIGVGMNAARLIQAVQQEKLAAWRVCDHIFEGLKTLRIVQSDLQRLIDETQTANHWLSRADIARLMGVKHTVVSKWVDAGLITPVSMNGNVPHFDEAQIQQFKGEHVFTEEAAEIIRIGILTVQKWIRGGRLKAVSGADIDGCHRWLLKRIDVERLRPENRLTAPQAAKLMGIGEAQFLVWIKQGRVQPVSGPGIDGMGQFLFLLDQITL